MGKWARARRTGSNKSYGTQPAPTLADFSIGTVTATTIPVNRLNPIPSPADRWGLLVVVKATGAVAFTLGLSAATPITATGLVTATTYTVRICWALASGLRVSEFSPSVDVTTP